MVTIGKNTSKTNENSRPQLIWGLPARLRLVVLQMIEIVLHGRDKMGKFFAAARRFITGPIEKTPRASGACILPLYLWYQS